MPFIWNDADWKLVDEENFKRNTEMYRGYVVVRKLFISSKKSFTNDVSAKIKHIFQILFNSI